MMIEVGATRIELARADVPVSADAEVFEEDTQLVLSAPPIIREHNEPAIQTLNAVWNAEPLAPGTAVLRGRRILAVVHALEQEPTTKAEWVEAAWHAAIALARARGWQRLLAPLLGTVHGRIERRAAVEALKAAAWQAGTPGLHLTLRLEARDLDATIAAFDS